MADKSRKGDLEFRLVDAITQTPVRVDNSGRLQITSVAATPVDTTSVIQTAVSSISASANTIYTITNAKTLRIQNFSAGAETNTTGGSKVTLYEDPNGDLSVLNVIARIYVNGASNEITLDEAFIGNGTRRIVMQRDTFGGGSREVFGRWKGYEE